MNAPRKATKAYLQKSPKSDVQLYLRPLGLGKIRSTDELRFERRSSAIRVQSSMSSYIEVIRLNNTRMVYTHT